MRARIPATVFRFAALCTVALASSIPAVAQGTPEQRAACEGYPDIDCITSCKSSFIIIRFLLVLETSTCCCNDSCC